MGISRIALSYESRTAVVHDTDALGLFDYQVSLQGAPFRPPKPGEDLYAVRHWLKTSGFHPHTRHKRQAGHRRNGFASTFIEHWSLNPPPAAANPDDFRPTFSIIYNRSTKQYEVVGLLGEVAASYKHRSAAQLTLLDLEAPLVYNALKECLSGYIYDRSDVRSRAIKAGQILATHSIESTAEERVFHINSQSTPQRIYRVHLPPAPHTWTCTIHHDRNLDRSLPPLQTATDLERVRRSAQPCPDIAGYAPDLGNGPRCKHLIAAYVLVKSGGGILPERPSLPFPRSRKKAPTVAAVEAHTAAAGKTTTAPDHTMPSKVRQPAAWPNGAVATEPPPQIRQPAAVCRPCKLPRTRDGSAPGQESAPGGMIP